MASTPIAAPSLETLADVLRRFHYIPPHRIRLVPLPGTATEQDVIAAMAARVKHLCELIDGTLVEKPMGYYESIVAGLLMRYLGIYLEEHDLGVLLAAAGTLRILPDQVRIPDVCFIAWDRFPSREELPPEPIPDLVPDLAVEVLSESNTKEEMHRKLRDYFRAGTRLVWYVDPEARTVRVHTSVRRSTLLREDQILDGGDVLPDFSLPLRKLFARAGRRPSR